MRGGVPGRSRRRPRGGESGFTLMELAVTMSIVGILAAIGMFGFWTWRDTSQHQGSAQELVSQLRNTSERAISEGRTYCVAVDAGGQSYTVWQKSCGGTGTQVAGPYSTQSSKVSFATTLTLPTPAPDCPASSSCFYFYPRGTAIPATVVVSSTSRSKTYTVHVEGLTARVWM